MQKVPDITTIERLFQYANTVRFLRARQVVSRASRAFRFSRAGGTRCDGLLLDGECCAWPDDACFLPPRAAGTASCDAETGAFVFLNDSRKPGFPPDWQPHAPLLWLYNLHYLDVLWELDFGYCRALVRDWAERNPCSPDNPGWDPYPVSVRLVNLCLLFNGRLREETEACPEFNASVRSMICRHARYLQGHLETHLLGNHYLENAVALAIAGSAYGGDAARKWLDSGMRILADELPEQFLPDGCHFELSPMYHARAVWLLLALAGTGHPALLELVLPVLRRAGPALAALTCPDGGLSLLNDSAQGIYTKPADLLAECERVTGAAVKPVTGVFALPDAGYYGYRTEDGTSLLCDAGNIGPDYIPGHAHGDMLSFTLSVRGQRVIVDGGTFGYEAGEMRDFCRSTRAHNTVEIEGLDQCEFWSAFRVARRGHIRSVDWQPADDGFRLAATHDGYRRLKCRAEHSRVFEWQDRRLRVRDTITAESSLRLVSRIHLHPDCRATIQSSDTARVCWADGSINVQFSGAGELSLEEQWYCPEFGKRMVSSCLAYTVQAPSSVEVGFVADVGGPQ